MQRPVKTSTRKDVSKLTAEVEKRFTELTAAVANISIDMATKTWVPVESSHLSSP
jgi:hypothetical protein